MRLRLLKVEKSVVGGGMFNDAKIWFGHEIDGKASSSLAPLCLIGPQRFGQIAVPAAYRRNLSGCMACARPKRRASQFE